MRSVKIHPTAIVDPAAKIGVDVEIGPYSSRGIAGDDSVKKRSCNRMSSLKDEVTIGSGNLIGHGA